MSLQTTVYGEYVVSELTLGQMREIRKRNVSPEDVQYAMAAAAISRNGVPITEDELNAMGIIESTELMRVVVRMNDIKGVEETEEGNV